MLQTFTLYDYSTGEEIAKLYKTYDGNWYDAPSEIHLDNTSVCHFKQALDELAIAV